MKTDVSTSTFPTSSGRIEKRTLEPFFKETYLYRKFPTNRWEGVWQGMKRALQTKSIGTKKRPAKETYLDGKSLTQETY